MGDQLASAYAKLARADTHLQELWSELKEFSSSNPYSIRSETNLKSTEKTIRCAYYVDRFTEPPEYWSLLIGDAIQNMRAALDHSTWALIISQCSNTFAKRNARKIYFPIHTAQRGFDEDTVASAVRPEARAVLEELQPYSRQKDNPKRDHFVALRELSNLDKHRALSLVVMRGHRSEVTTRPFLQGGRAVFVEGGPLRRGAQVVRFTAARPPPPAQVEVDFSLAVEISVESPKPAANVPLNIGLRELRSRTGEAVVRIRDIVA